MRKESVTSGGQWSMNVANTTCSTVLNLWFFYIFFWSFASFLSLALFPPTSILHFKLRLGNIFLYLPLIKWISYENYHVMQTIHTREPCIHDKSRLFVCSLICESFFFSFAALLTLLCCWRIFICYIFRCRIWLTASGYAQGVCVKCQLTQWIWMNKCTTSHGGNKLIACAQITNTHTHNHGDVLVDMQNVSMKVNCLNNFINNLFF